MGKAIFRVSGVKTTADLRGIGKHNLDRKSETNKDIDLSRSHENITLKNCTGTYSEMFNHVTEDLQKQHDEQMKTTRKSRQKSFQDKINDDKADIACEFLMSATPEYFEGMSHEKIREWGESSLDFITDEIGIDKENILHAVVHMDEKTPHLHVVAVPLIEKYDGRRKQDVLAISRKHFIKTREDMAKVQTRYVEHMNEKGFDLERGLEKSGTKHLDVARYKVQESQKELAMTENALLERKNELLALNDEVLDEIKVPVKREFKNVEVESKEKNILGFPKKEIQKQPTGNIIISEDDFKKMMTAAKQNEKIKGALKNYLNTDLVQENQKLKNYIKDSNSLTEKLNNRIEQLKKENTKLFWENDLLKDQISDLKRDIKLVYQSAKEFLKERTNDFRGHLKDFVDKVKGKTSQSHEKLNLEPKMNEFEKVHKQEKNKEFDRGFER